MGTSSFDSEDEEFLTDILNRYGQKILESLIKRGVPHPDAEEILQDTALEACQNRQHFDQSQGELGDWIQGISNNLAKRFFAKTKQEKEKQDEMSPNNDPADDDAIGGEVDITAFREDFHALSEEQQEIMHAWAGAGKNGRWTHIVKHLKKDSSALRKQAIDIRKKLCGKHEERQGEKLKQLLRGMSPTPKRQKVDQQQTALFSKEGIEKIIRLVRTKSGVTFPASSPSDPRLAETQYLRTGFESLDTLLGGDGLVRGSSILLRGDPGSGKTTLALQIANNAIRNEDFAFVFASVEDDPKDLLNHITKSYWGKDYEQYLEQTEAYEVRDLTNYFDRDVMEGVYQKKLDETVEKHGLSRIDEADLRSVPHEEAKRLLGPEVRAEMLSERYAMELEELLVQFWESLPAMNDRPILLVIDSLNALINCASVRFHKIPDREILQTVLHSFRKWRRSRPLDVTVIFIAEEESKVVNAAASYVADTVIKLSSEQIEQGIRETPDADHPPRRWVLDVRFLRVLKGRGLPIQNRACCYEFVKREKEDERGIEFFPTYAAPGIVSLFQENEPMRQVIENLRNTDVPTSYPQVVVHEFSRSALQRIFSVRRHSNRIIPRHPLMLNNVDEHWLKVLKQENLVEPIPVSKLDVFSLKLHASATNGAYTSVIKELWNKKHGQFTTTNEKGEPCFVGVPQIANVGMMVYRKDVLQKHNVEPPQTWEDLEKICLDIRESNKSKTEESEKDPCKFLLETLSYDTFLATALELIWSHAGFWRTVSVGKHKLGIDFDPHCSAANVIAALTRLKYWVHHIKIVPDRSTVDPLVYNNTDWLFARHWYSTWVDVMTTKEASEFDENAKFGVIPIPMAQFHREKSKDPKHHSAWGEWYLAIQRGSENVELGIDLINNLMTARKITERALSGAALPTIEKFYELTDEICPHTDLTFNQLRKQLLEDAKSRTEFDDYPKFARIFAGVLRTIVTNRNADICGAVKRAFNEIAPGFIWPSDVRETTEQLLPRKVFASIS